MNTLANLGQMYLFVLLALLIVGSGFAAWAFNDNMTKQIEKARATKQLEIDEVKDLDESNKINGGNVMANNGWFKLTVFSFVGILISVALMGFIGVNGSAQNNAALLMNNGQMNVQSQSQSKSQSLSQSNMQTGNMNSNSSMNNMGTQNNQMNSQDQFQQMQQQLNQIQQQMNNIQNGNMNNNQQNTQQNNSNMQQMPQNNISTQQNNSSSNSNVSGSGSSSSMSMM